jgi:hypothetical protein
VASAERYRTNKRKGRDKEAARIVTGGEATKSERRPEQMKDTAKRNRATRRRRFGQRESAGEPTHRERSTFLGLAAIVLGFRLEPRCQS